MIYERAIEGMPSVVAAGIGTGLEQLMDLAASSASSISLAESTYPRWFEAALGRRPGNMAKYPEWIDEEMIYADQPLPQWAVSALDMAYCTLAAVENGDTGSSIQDEKLHRAIDATIVDASNSSFRSQVQPFYIFKRLNGKDIKMPGPYRRYLRPSDVPKYYSEAQARSFAGNGIIKRRMKVLASRLSLRLPSLCMATGNKIAIANAQNGDLGFVMAPKVDAYSGDCEFVWYITAPTADREWELHLRTNGATAEMPVTRGNGDRGWTSWFTVAHGDEATFLDQASAFVRALSASKNPN